MIEVFKLSGDKINWSLEFCICYVRRQCNKSSFREVIHLEPLGKWAARSISELDECYFRTNFSSDRSLLLQWAVWGVGLSVVGRKDVFGLVSHESSLPPGCLAPRPLVLVAAPCPAPAHGPARGGVQGFGRQEKDQGRGTGIAWAALRTDCWWRSSLRYPRIWGEASL